jgi:hypothetical protein
LAGRQHKPAKRRDIVRSGKEQLAHPWSGDIVIDADRRIFIPAKRRFERNVFDRSQAIVDCILIDDQENRGKLIGLVATQSAPRRSPRNQLGVLIP